MYHNFLEIKPFVCLTYGFRSRRMQLLMKRSIYIAVVFAAAVLMPSCQQMQPVSKETIPVARVDLAQNNYRVLATRVSAEDAGFCILPIAGTVVNTVAQFITFRKSDVVVPAGIEVLSPSEADAFKELYRKTGADQPGRATQLINIRKEYGGVNALIFGRPKVRITADLIEFTH